MKILAFTTDIVPISGLPTSGTALRSYGFIQGLRSQGHEVTVSVPRSAVTGFADSFDVASLEAPAREEFETLREQAFDAANQSALVSSINPDVIYCGHWPAMTLYSKPSQPLVIDLAGPHLLERHYQRMPNQSGAILGKLSAVSKGDFFIVSGPTQRLYFLSFLLRAQIEQPEKRIVTIPMPLSPEQPLRRERDAGRYPHFVFGGVFLPWQDPSFALRQIGSELTRRTAGRLTLIGGRHPNYEINAGVYDRLFKELSDNPFCSSKPLLPYRTFIDELLEKDVAIDLMKWNLERQLAVTIRTTTYLWAGVPVIYNDYADLGDLIRRYDAGWCVPPESHDDLAAVLTEIYDNPSVVQRKSDNARRLAQEVFAWDRAVRPLLELLQGPASKRLRETDIILDFPDSADLPVTYGREVEQYFLCRVDGLTRIECRIATHNRTINTPLTLSLYEVEKANDFSLRSSTRQLVTRTDVVGDSLRNNEWCGLDVEPIADSAGKTFVFRMESDEESAAASASPWAVKDSPYPLLGLYHGERCLEHTSLCLRTTCAGPHV